MLTTEQIRRRTKDVTRRLGWVNVKVGELLQGCEKCQGRKKGEPLVKLAVIQVVSVKREKLRALSDDPNYGRRECLREGFPTDIAAFVEMFCKHNGCDPETTVTRIEFRYVS